MVARPTKYDSVIQIADENDDIDLQRAIARLRFAQLNLAFTRQNNMPKHEAMWVKRVLTALDSLWHVQQYKPRS